MMKNEIKKIAIDIIKKSELNVIRIGLIGPSKTGKTSLINSIINNQDNVYLKPTNKLIFYDITEQEQFGYENIVNILENIDIFVFVNDNKKKEIKKLIYPKVDFKNKKYIYCINKLDLIKKEEEFEKEYKEKNKNIIK